MGISPLNLKKANNNVHRWVAKDMKASARVTVAEKLPSGLTKTWVEQRIESFFFSGIKICNIIS